MKEFEGRVRQEILALERRVEQLNVANAATDRLLVTLSHDAEAAWSSQDTTSANRLDRRANTIRLRRSRADAEIKTLHDLIAARRQHYGLALPAPE